MTASPPRRNALEWVVFALGALLVGAVVAYLVVALFSGAGAPPSLRVALGAPAPGAGQVLVPVTVENAGGRVAEEVRVEVCAAAGAPCAEIAFPYVPRDAERHGEVGFREAPAGPLEARVLSYREP